MEQKPVNVAEAATRAMPVPEVVELLASALRAAQRGTLIAVAIGSVYETLQFDGCSRSREDFLVHNLLKSAAHQASLCSGIKSSVSILGHDSRVPPRSSVLNLVPSVRNLVQAKLDHALDGRIRGVVLAMVGSDYQIADVWAFESELVENLLVGMSGELGHSVLHAMSIVPEGPRQPAVVEGAELEAGVAAQAGVTAQAG